MLKLKILLPLLSSKTLVLILKDFYSVQFLLCCDRLYVKYDQIPFSLSFDVEISLF